MAEYSGGSLEADHLCVLVHGVSEPQPRAVPPSHHLQPQLIIECLL